MKKLSTKMMYTSHQLPWLSFVLVLAGVAFCFVLLAEIGLRVTGLSWDGDEGMHVSKSDNCIYVIRAEQPQRVCKTAS